VGSACLGLIRRAEGVHAAASRLRARTSVENPAQQVLLEVEGRSRFADRLAYFLKCTLAWKELPRAIAFYREARALRVRYGY